LVVGTSFQWRQPRTVEARGLARTIAFGGRRDRGTGYLAFSERVGPCVLVLPDPYGPQKLFESHADALRDEGFTALVPDLYDGVVAETPEEAAEIASSLDSERTMLRVRAAATHLTDTWHPRLGAVGFSLGAWFACELAQEGGLEATVLYSGLGDLRSGRWQGPVQGHFAEPDERVERGALEAFVAQLEDQGADVEVALYPGTGRPLESSSADTTLSPEAAELAYRRTIDFLRYHLA
jgi:carboxymethylenebutenolidase